MKPVTFAKLVMKRIQISLVVIVLWCSAVAGLAQGTAFTYQGRLNDGTEPATGVYDLRFAIYDAFSAGNQVGGALTNAATGVSEGLFTVILDFGNQFSGNRWLEIAVRTNGSSAFATLSPRQQLTSTPFAIQSLNALSAGSVSAANIFGTIPLSKLPAAVVTNGASGLSLTGMFSGDGTGVTNVPVAALVQPAQPLTLWGANEFGLTSVPLEVESIAGYSAGLGHNLVLQGNGTVIAWGNTNFGQTDVPVGVTGVTAISAGTYHNLALKSDGTVVSWGSIGADWGQTNVPSGLTDVIAISAGGAVSAALKADGSVVVWGDKDNTFGATNVPAGLNDVMAVSAGGVHGVLLRSNGTVVAWGNNDYGQTDVPAGLTNVVAVSAGLAHTLALKSDGTVVAWGTNSLGNPGELDVPSGLSNVVAISADFAVSMALKADGTVVAWGGNTFGVTNVPAGLSGVTGIDAGGYSSGALVSSEWAPAQLALLTENNAFSGSITAASFSGDGAGLTNLNASHLTSGTVPNERISGLYSQTVTFFNDTNTFRGTFVGNGFNISSLNASALQIGTVPGAVLTGNYFLPISFLNFNNAYWGGFTGDGAGLTNLGASQLTGTVPSAALAGAYANALTFNNAANAFTGNGSGLNNLNASQLASGTVPDARLTANVSLLGPGIESSEITDGTIVNADINSAAAIADTKLATISTAGKVADNALSSNVSLLGPAIESSEITDGAIANVDINAAAGIADTKLATISTAGKVADSALSSNVARRAGGNTFNGTQIITNGSVGIATTSPGRMLQLGGPANTEAMIRLNSTASDGIAGRAWDVGVPKSDTSAAGKFFSFTVQDSAATLPAFLVQWSSGNVGIYNTNPPALFTVGNSISPATCNGTTWINGSDRNAKEDFAPVDTADVLARVVLLPVQSWSYKAQPGAKHIGPMAQDFHAAFGLNGENDTHIATVDEGGVALAAIQGLNQKLEAKLEQKEVAIAELRERLETLERLLKTQRSVLEQ